MIVKIFLIYILNLLNLNNYYLFFNFFTAAGPVLSLISSLKSFLSSVTCSSKRPSNSISSSNFYFSFLPAEPMLDSLLCNDSSLFLPRFEANPTACLLYWFFLAASSFFFYASSSSMTFLLVDQIFHSSGLYFM